VAIGCLAAQGHTIFAFLFAVSRKLFRFCFRLFRRTRSPWKSRPRRHFSLPRRRYYWAATRGDPAVPEVGILIVDDDIASQRALKNVSIPRLARPHRSLVSHALAELATGSWNSPS